MDDIGLAKYILRWLRERNGGELGAAFADMKLGDYERCASELSLILKHDGKPPNWDT